MPGSPHRGVLQQVAHTGMLPSRWVGHTVVDFLALLGGGRLLLQSCDWLVRTGLPECVNAGLRQNGIFFDEVG